MFHRNNFIVIDDFVWKIDRSNQICSRRVNGKLREVYRGHNLIDRKEKVNER